MNENKAVFLDRDGTLNEDFGYVQTIEQFKWVSGAREALKYFKSRGYLLVVISNQSGIARGYFAEESVRILHEYLQQHLLQTYQIQINAFYFCPHHPDGVVERYAKLCNCRKPAAGLFERAITELEIEISQSAAIGDQERDLIPAEAIGIPHLYLLDMAEKCDSVRSNHYHVIKSWAEVVEHHQRDS